MSYTNGIATIVNGVHETKQGLLAAALQVGRQRAANVSEELTRVGAAAAYAEKLNAAAFELIHRLYMEDTDSTPRDRTFAHVDAVSGRFLIPAPWGSVGRPLYGLRRTEGDTLRRYVLYLAQQRRPTRLFWCQGFRWHLNLREYPDLEDALLYWRLVEMTAATWRMFTTQAPS